MALSEIYYKNKLIFKQKKNLLLFYFKVI